MRACKGTNATRVTLGKGLEQAEDESAPFWEKVALDDKDVVEMLGVC
jgi:hypothetical protein